MLYELLTGTIPFSGPTPIELMQQHLNAPLPPLAAHRAGLPEAWDDIIAHATAKDPLERYADVESLLDDLRTRDAVVAVGHRSVDSPAPTNDQVLTSDDNPYKGSARFWRRRCCTTSSGAKP